MKKLAMGVLATLLTTGLVSLVGVVGASAKAAKGTATCSGLGATVTFKPPLTSTGTSKEKSTIKPITLSGCSSSGSPVSPTKVTATIKVTGTNSCASFAENVGSDSLILVVKWSGASPTKVTFVAGTISVNSTESGFLASGGKATGSYATTTGAGFSANLQSSAGLVACIGGSGSVSSLQISSGSATL